MEFYYYFNKRILRIHHYLFVLDTTIQVYQYQELRYCTVENADFLRNLDEIEDEYRYTLMQALIARIDGLSNMTSLTRDDFVSMVIKEGNISDIRTSQANHGLAIV
ncbi:MAG: hypothetical protein INQ03_12395 [Candidatus Heimdallarchaeota archaeon]|nr:hypothetical protein [Candidatus Heimdallarchaeota archaeon]